MKPFNRMNLKSIAFFYLASFYSAIAFAQDSSVTTTNKETSTTYTKPTETMAQPHDWYTQPWVWIIGGIILLVILILLFSRNKNNVVSTDKVTVTKTVRTENDIN